MRVGGDGIALFVARADVWPRVRSGFDHGARPGGVIERSVTAIGQPRERGLPRLSAGLHAIANEVQLLLIVQNSRMAKWLCSCAKRADERKQRDCQAATFG